jgi:hybrid polyketide synthase / nonribosomal peptide synthetase ACE1
MALSKDETIISTVPLVDAGVDSLVAVDVRTWFAQEVGIDMAVMKILGGLSVQDLVEEAVQKIVESRSTDDGASATSSSMTDTQLGDDSSTTASSPMSVTKYDHEKGEKGP